MNRRIASLPMTIFIAIRQMMSKLIRNKQPSVPHADDTTTKRGHEASDLDIRAATLSGIALLAALALVLVIASLMQFAFTEQLPSLQPPSGGLSANPATPVPNRVTQRANPEDDVNRVRAEEDKQLHSYGWVDQKSGVVHIPIERAMDLLLQRGLPARAQSESGEFHDKGNELPSDSSSGRMMERVR